MHYLEYTQYFVSLIFLIVVPTPFITYTLDRRYKGTTVNTGTTMTNYFKMLSDLIVHIHLLNNTFFNQNVKTKLKNKKRSID